MQNNSDKFALDEQFRLRNAYDINGSQLAKLKKSIPDMSLPWYL